MASHSWLHNVKGTVAIPTHYYKIVTRCLTNEKPYHQVRDCNGRLDVISIILPHVDTVLCKVNLSFLFWYKSELN